MSGSVETSEISPPRFLTVKEVANYLRISERKLWELTNKGEIPCRRIGRLVRYDRYDLDAWFMKGKVSHEPH